MPYYHVNNDLSKARGANGDLDWFVMNHPCELIDDDKDRVVTVFFPIRQNW